MISPLSPDITKKTKFTCPKIFLISYSVIFWLLGVILLAVGVWAKVSLNAYDFMISEESTIASYVLIGTGAVIVVFGLFGCIATCKGSPWLLKMYGFFSMLVCLAMLAAGTSGFLFRPKVRNTVANFFTKAVNHHSTSDSVSTLVDTMQRNLQCCGQLNFGDWSYLDDFSENGIPDSCCKVGSTCTSDVLKDVAAAQSVVYNDGCLPIITKAVQTNLAIVAGVSFGIAFFHFIGIIMSCWYSRYLTFTH